LYNPFFTFLLWILPQTYPQPTCDAHISLVTLKPHDLRSPTNKKEIEKKKEHATCQNDFPTKGVVNVQ
jgi:hypothetical protein